MPDITITRLHLGVLFNEIIPMIFRQPDIDTILSEGFLNFLCKKIEDSQKISAEELCKTFNLSVNSAYKVLNYLVNKAVLEYVFVFTCNGERKELTFEELKAWRAEGVSLDDGELMVIFQGKETELDCMGNEATQKNA